ASGVAMALAWATGARAALINVGDNLSISDAPGDVSGPIAPGLYDTGYVNNGQGGTSYQNVYSGVFDVTVVNQSQLNKTFTIGTFCTDVGIDWNNTPNTAYTAM